MAAVWRLTSPSYARLLDGEGSRTVGGRWNSPGLPALYTSSHLSLSVLEVFVHMPAQVRDDLPPLEAVRIAIPDDASSVTISISRFERLMAAVDPLTACRTVGDAWLARGEELLLWAPSVVVPEDMNVIINPTHVEMRRVQIERTRRFHFDPRLVGGG